MNTYTITFELTENELRLLNAALLAEGNALRRKAKTEKAEISKEISITQSNLMYKLSDSVEKYKRNAGTRLSRVAAETPLMRPGRRSQVPTAEKRSKAKKKTKGNKTNEKTHIISINHLVGSGCLLPHQAGAHPKRHIYHHQQRLRLHRHRRR